MALQVIAERESATLSSLDLPYWVRDPDLLPGQRLSRNAAVAAAAVAAENEIGVEPDDYSATRLSHAVFRVVIQYRTRELQPLTPIGASGLGPAITVESGFNSEPRRSEWQKYSLGTVAAYNAADGTAATLGGGQDEARDHKGGINVPWSNGGSRWPEGHELIVPPETDYVNFVIPNGAFTPSYRAVVESLLWKVNSHEFNGKPAGSVMLVRAQARRQTDNSMHIGFGFSHRPNGPRTIAGVTTAASVDGHDFAWCYAMPELVDEDGNKALAWALAFIYIERIWERADLNLLALPE